MTTTKGQYGAYSNKRGTSLSQDGSATEDNRETDKRALLRCAGRLQAAIDDGGKDMKAYGEALRHNQKLWTIFQVALCDPENPLPKHLKENLLSLSRYIDRVSFRAVAQYAPQLLHELIKLNRTIAAGLNSKKPAATQAQPQQQAMNTVPPASGGAPSSVMTTA